MSRGFNAISRLLFGKKKSKKASRSRRLGRPSLSVEPLETRIVLASDCLGAIQGIVAVDNNANSMIDAGEEVAGAQVQIFLDNGDGIFNAADSLQATLTTDANGMYSVDDLITGNYFAVQSAGTFGGQTLMQMVSPIKSVDGNGIPGTLIDNFDTDNGPIEDNLPAGTPMDGSFTCLLYTSPSPRDATLSRMPSSA